MSIISSSFSCCKFGSVVVLLCLLNSVQLYAQNKPRKDVKIQINPNATLTHIPQGFIGFGYETSAVAQSDFFSGDNTMMIRLYRNLSRNGLIRIGGIISDHTLYRPNATAVSRTMRNPTIINKMSLKNLSDFAQKTGWKVMWGLNLQTSSPEKVTQEAIAVDKALGDRLHSFEIGNEVDNHPRFDHQYSSYYKTYQHYKKAVRNELPEASFSGPDVAGNINWVQKFAHDQSKDIKLITAHYYRGGGKDSTSTLQKLLSSDKNLENKLKRLYEISTITGIPYRINETNSFYSGGRLGVSDTFASALWCLDYMFILASHGSRGVNIETSINQHAWVSHYSPFVRNTSGRYTIRPIYYGMLAFSMTGKGDILQLKIDKNNMNLSAYATKQSRKYFWVTIINKDLTTDAFLDIDVPKGYSHAKVLRLKAPSAKSKTNVSLAGAHISSDGKWDPKNSKKIIIKNHAVHLTLPHASAAFVQIRH